MTRLPAGKLPGQILGRLLANYPVADERVLIGPGMGRDSAAISFGETALVVKTDPISFPTDRAAHHLIHVNANDIACQGAIPRWLVVTALLPHGLTTTDSVESLFRELNVAASEIGISIIGGHTEITMGLDRPILVGTMLGEAVAARLINPANAAPGDRLLMTKTAGIEGTVVLACALEQDGAYEQRLISRAKAFIDHPGISILAEASSLARAGIPTALHDPTEGGIVTAVREMALAAGAGAVISRDAIPVSAETRELTDSVGIDPLGLLASGSLLAAIPKDRIEQAENVLNAIGIPFSWIGKLTPAEFGFRMRAGAQELDLPDFATDEVARFLSLGA